MAGADVGATVEVEASLDTSAVYIGDIITYRLVITYDEGDSIMNVPHAVNLYAFQVRDYRPITRERMSAGRWRQGELYWITAFRPGTYVIPPIPVEYRTAAGRTGELVTQALTIEIRSLGVTESDTLRRIKPPVEMPAKVRGWVWVTLASFGFLALVVAAVALKLRLRQPEKAARTPEVVDELAEFDRILASELRARGQVKQLYVLVSEAMRRYMGRRYRITAMELTHEELAREMRRANVSERESALLLEFLDRCDLVKFARFIPSDEEVRSLVERAKQLVRETQFRLPPAVGPGAADAPGVANPEPVPVEATSDGRRASGARPDQSEQGGAG